MSKREPTKQIILEHKWETVERIIYASLNRVYLCTKEEILFYYDSGKKIGKNHLFTIGKSDNSIVYVN